MSGPTWKPMPRGGVEHDWWAESVKLRRRLRAIEKAALAVLAKVDANLDGKGPPFKYGAPFGELTELREAIEKHGTQISTT